MGCLVDSRGLALILKLVNLLSFQQLWTEWIKIGPDFSEAASGISVIRLFRNSVHFHFLWDFVQSLFLSFSG